MLPKEFFYLIALMAGAGIAVQAGMNAQLRLATGNPILTALISFLVGTIILLGAYLLSTKTPPPFAAIADLSWWKFMGGVMGTLYITGVIILAPRIGAANTIGFTIAGQLICAVVLDHFGWVGFPVRPISVVRVLGVFLMMAGIYLVQKY
jgi:bacterial/archaeal transporter family-2 protein